MTATTTPKISGSPYRTTKALVALAVAVALFAPSTASAVDVDRDGDHDMLVREGQFYPRTAGGDCYSSYRVEGGVRRLYAKLSVRPPAAWPLWGLAQQNVAWRANFFNAANSQYLTSSPWESAVVSAGGTLFGGQEGGMLGTRPYLAGHHYYEHDANVSVRAAIEVAWQDPNTGRWVHGTDWVNDMTIQHYGGVRLPDSGGMGYGRVGTALLQRNSPRC